MVVGDGDMGGGRGGALIRIDEKGDKRKGKIWPKGRWRRHRQNVKYVCVRLA